VINIRKANLRETKYDMHEQCIIEAVSLINNLSDIILWKAMSLPVGDFMIERITTLFNLVVENCFGEGTTRL